MPLASDSRPRFVGTPEQLAAHVAAWHAAAACDGFDILPAVMPLDLDLLVTAVVPLLRARGLRPAGTPAAPCASTCKSRAPSAGSPHDADASRCLHLSGRPSHRGLAARLGRAHWDPGLRLLSPHRRGGRARQVRPGVRRRHAGGTRKKDGRVHRAGRAEQHRFDLDPVGRRRRTTNVGLVATLSTTYNEPFAIAERFAFARSSERGPLGVEHHHDGQRRCGADFSRKSHMEKTMRYQRAKEFVDICKALWGGWEEGAIVADRAHGTFVDSAKVHEIDHKGQFFAVRGALDLPRPPQGWPVMVQAGGSPGRPGVRGHRGRGDFRGPEQSRAGDQVPRRRQGAHARGHGRDPAIPEGAAGAAADPGLDRERGAREGADA